MLEYTNTGFLILGGIACTMLLLGAILASGKAIHENRKSKAPYFFLGVAAFVIALTIGEGLDTKDTIEKNITKFQNGGELKCVTFAATYLVSKETGWQLRKEDFIKDSILLDARYCEE